MSHQLITESRVRGAFAACALLVLTVPGLAAAAPVIHYTDLAAGPNSGGAGNTGAVVTLYGRGFGATRGSGLVTIGGGPAATYVSWADTKVVVAIGSQARSGPIVVRDNAGAASNGVPFTVRAGRVLEATTSTIGNLVSSAQSGDIIYLRGGSYTGRYGSTDWGNMQFTLGPSLSDVAFVAYPGETVNVRDWRLGNQSGHANGVTIAGMVMRATEQCVQGNHYWENEESGARNARIVANDCQASYNYNTLTGMMALGGDGWKILGNVLHDTGTSPPINNNHALYIQVGADDVEVAWNRLERLRMGHVIQVHTDGTARVYSNIQIHDNELTGAAPGDMRGIVSGNLTNDSTVFVYNNVFKNLGQDVSAVLATGGTVVVEHNTFDRISASSGAVQVSWGGAPRITARNNIVNMLSGSAFGATNGSSLSQITQLGNRTNVALTNDRPTAAAPGVTPTYPIDHAGLVRDNPPTVGAYELNGATVLTPNPPTALLVN
jgi:hypothetical protein